MARMRAIKPGFFLDDELAECPIAARLLFAGLWTIADREGRLADKPKQIKIQTLPWDDVDTDALLTELAARGFIIRYAVDGHRYIAIPTWHRHQTPHKTERESVIPPPLNGTSTVKAPLINGSATPRTEQNRTDTEPDTDTGARAAARGARFSEYWTPYPKKDSRVKAQAAFKKLDDEAQDQAIRSVPVLIAWAAATGTETRFLPGATVWLNQRRFDLWHEGPPDGYEPSQYKERNGRGLSGDDLMALADSFEGRERLAIGGAT
jgi:hypothetical protein